MLDDRIERYLIQKMAEIVSKYQEPYDEYDEKAAKNNAPLEVEYNIYKKLLEDLEDL